MLWLDHVRSLSTVWVDTSLAVGLSAGWSSSVVLAFAVGSQTEMHKQILCSADLAAHIFAIQLGLQRPRSEHSTFSFPRVRKAETHEAQQQLCAEKDEGTVQAKPT